MSEVIRCLALDGALTIGTLDGANIEIRDEVGEENIFIFGLRADEVSSLIQTGYHPEQYMGTSHNVRRVVDTIAAGHFSRGDKDTFRPIIQITQRQRRIRPPRRSRLLSRNAAAGRRGLARSRPVESQVAAEHRKDGEVLIGSDNRRIRAGYLADQGGGDWELCARGAGVIRSRRTAQTGVFDATNPAPVVAQALLSVCSGSTKLWDEGYECDFEGLAPLTAPRAGRETKSNSRRHEVR